MQAVPEGKHLEKHSWQNWCSKMMPDQQIKRHMYMEVELAIKLACNARDSFA
jgi:hypothetical protein